MYKLVVSSTTPYVFTSTLVQQQTAHQTQSCPMYAISGEFVCLQASNTATAVDDDEYVVGDDDSAQDVLEDGNDTDDLPPSKGEGDIIREQTAVAAAVQRPFSNADAGADVAMQLLRLCESLGGSATAQDYEQILKVGHV